MIESRIESRVESSYPLLLGAVYRGADHQFLILQLVGWFGLSLISFFSLTVWYNQQFNLAYVGHPLVQSVLGIFVSWPLRWLFNYYWHQRALFRISAAITGVLVCSMLWTLLRLYTFMEMTGEAGLWSDFGPWLFASILIFLSWGAFYHGIKYYQLLQREHDHSMKLASEKKAQELRRSRAETIAHEAQLKMLRYQLNPHFLFNTLNAISALVEIKDVPRANGMIVQLSDFLRYSLDNDPIQRVSLEKELEALKLYLNIEQVRFGSRLQLEFDIARGADVALIPSLILQPLVENAIKHAIAPMETGGKISVTAGLDGEFLTVEVKDTGPGISPPDKHTQSSGVGLRNTVDRLQEFYGDNYEFRLEDIESGGLRAVMRLPMEKQAFA